MWILGLLLIIGVWEGVKAGYKALGDERQKGRKVAHGKQKGHGKKSRVRSAGTSARHDAGFWASEVLHGAPRFRHGFASGWSDHQKARDIAYGDRQRATADQLETRYDIIRDTRRQQKRIAEAKRAIENEKAAETPSAPDLTAVPGGADGQERKGGRRYSRPPASTEQKPPANGQEFSAEGQHVPLPSELAAGQGWKPAPVKTEGGGKTEGIPASTPDSAPGSSGDADGPETNDTTEGEPQMPPTAETTYTQDVEEANAIVAEAEQHLADLNAHRWQDRMDALAGAGLDTQTLSHAANVNDGINDQVKAAEQTLESATAFRDGLVQTHGAGHEYHSTTQGGGAEKSYLQDQ